MPISFRVDQAETDLVFSKAAPKTKRNESGVYEQTSDRLTGMPQWFVHCFVSAADSEAAEDDEVWKVVVPARSAPAFEKFAPIFFDGLRARMWTLDTGKSGISLSASDIHSA